MSIKAFGKLQYIPGSLQGFACAHERPEKTPSGWPWCSVQLEVRLRWSYKLSGRALKAYASTYTEALGKGWKVIGLEQSRYLCPVISKPLSELSRDFSGLHGQKYRLYRISPGKSLNSSNNKPWCPQQLWNLTSRIKASYSLKCSVFNRKLQDTLEGKENVTHGNGEKNSS